MGLSDSALGIFFLKRKWLSILVTIFAISIGLGTMFGSYSLWRKNKNRESTPFWPFDDDISDYGMPAHTPQYYLFAGGFTTLATFVVIIMFIRACQVDHIVSRNGAKSKPGCGKVSNTFLFVIGACHSVPLAIMGWTDGVKQTVHFIMAIVGLGILAIYGIWHSCLAAALLLGKVYKNSSGQSPSNGIQALRFIFFLWHFACSVGSPICVVLWIVWQASPFEWAAVGLLFVYFVPYVFEFFMYDYETSYAYVSLSTTLD